MHIVSGTASGALGLASLGRELSPNARRRLKWMDYYQSHGHNARLTRRHFDISPQTFYRWLRRYNPRELVTLEERSRRPQRRRRLPGVLSWGSQCNRCGSSSLVGAKTNWPPC